ncbi:hypothetical protein D915_001788 [Fasciola hepatica]|uniref:Ionotropic glutamate receptor L-glutamate and glycine-binding domain-containing protein n=1 Tax=Fasciola hepatica TaxID=6192 RepID=A0A4E0RP97_FASHE|nr:hypothetical protein D915_001788 [Fasciola hepatica]
MLLMELSQAAVDGRNQYDGSYLKRYRINRGSKQTTYSTGPETQSLESILSELDFNTDGFDFGHYVFIHTSEPHIEYEIKTLLKYPKLLRTYYWIFSHRLEIPVAHLLRLIPRSLSSTMNIGFLRYVPFLNAEDCVESLGFAGRAMRKLNGCDMTAYPDRVAATIHALLAYVFTCTPVTESKLHSVSCSNSSATYEDGDNDFFELVMSQFYEEWNTLLFYSLETQPNGSSAFRLTVKIPRDQPGELTEHGRNILRQGVLSGLFGNRFRGFHGAVLRVGVIQEEPLLMGGVVNRSGQIVGARGMIVDIVEILAQRFDFRYELYLSSDGMYGVRGENKEWNGLMKDLLEKRIDMIGAQLMHTAERASEIQFLGSFMDEQLGIMVASPVRRGGLFLMFEPFTINAWLMCIGCVILSALLSHAVHCYCSTSAGHHLPRSVTPRQISLAENIWSYIRSFLARGPDRYPTIAASRVIILSFWTFILLMHSFWEADITAYLTREVVRLPFNTLEELTAQDKFKPLLIEGSASYEMCKNANHGSAYRILFEKFSAHNVRPKNLKEATEILLNDPTYALVASYNLLLYVTQKHCGQLKLSDRTRVQNNVGFAVLPEVNYISQLSKYMTLMKETGVTHRLEAKWWFQNNICSTDETQYRALTLRDVGGAMIILGFCICVGLLALGVEQLWHRFGRIRCANKEPPKLKVQMESGAKSETLEQQG